MQVLSKWLSRYIKDLVQGWPGKKQCKANWGTILPDLLDFQHIRLLQLHPQCFLLLHTTCILEFLLMLTSRLQHSTKYKQWKDLFILSYIPAKKLSTRFYSLKVQGSTILAAFGAFPNKRYFFNRTIIAIFCHKKQFFLIACTAFANMVKMKSQLCSRTWNVNNGSVPSGHNFT